MDEAMKELVQEAVSGDVFGVWFLMKYSKSPSRAGETSRRKWR